MTSSIAKKRILLVHRYYWPDVPAYAQMLHIMAKRFAAEGYDVSVFSTQPDYNGIYAEGRAPALESIEGVAIRRLTLLKENKKRVVGRAFNVLWFCFRLVLHCLWHRYDLMMVASFPPTVMGYMARWICWLRGMKYVYHIQDLYPEVALASGLTKSSGLLKLSAKVDRANCQRAARVIVLSGDMKAALAKRGISTDHVRIINNFVIDKMQSAPANTPQLEASKFHVIFAGNMGRFQGLETLMEVAELLKSNSLIQFDFVGSGALKDKLRQQALEGGLSQVHFYDHQPLQAVMQMTRSANLSVISLGPGVIYCAYPSKTMSYLESGARLLAIVEPDSELVEFIGDNDLGVTAEQGDAQAIARVIESEFDQWRAGKRYDAEHARQVADTNFSQAVILEKWLAMFEELFGRAGNFESTYTAPPSTDLAKVEA